MAKIRDPKLFSAMFGIEPKRLRKLGVFDPILNADSKLFIDPLLLSKSAHQQIRENAYRAYRHHFKQVIRLLRASKTQDDPAWRAARKHFEFHEVVGTCLGYGSNSIQGSGFGAALTNRVLHTAQEIIELGVDDPDLFVLMALFEEGIGPDRISDMTTNVILFDLLLFTESICAKLQVPTQPFGILGRMARLPRNATQAKRTPVILLPTDLLRDLPVALDREDISRVTFETELVRRGINADVGEIWRSHSKKEKAERKKLILSSRAAVEGLIATAAQAKKKPYDYDADPLGVLTWRRIHTEIAQKEPAKLTLARNPSPWQVLQLVQQIIHQFQHLVEKRGLWKLLYHKGEPRHESNVQMIFFAVADAYCKANGIDISPETDSGNGPVDFKLSKGSLVRVLVEVKLSTNPKIVTGYTNQLEIYKDAEETTNAIYLIVDVGSLGKKFKRLEEVRRQRVKDKLPVSEIVLVDSLPKESASKRRC